MSVAPPVVAHDAANVVVPPRRRRAWIAAVLTFIVSGLGQLYAGRARRAVLIFLLANAASVVFIVAWMRWPTFGLIVVALLLVLSAKIAFIIDAARVARVAPIPFALKAYNRWYIYIVVWLVAAFVISPQYQKDVRRRYQAFRIPSESMEPTWMAGDFLMSAPIKHPPNRGEVVVYQLDNVTFLKRVVAIPGDTVAMSNGQLSIDGDSVSEPYARRGDPYASDPPYVDSTNYDWQKRSLLADVNATLYHPTLKNWGPLVVPGKNYFVLGDNRDESMDSRMKGFVPADAIFARPLFVYWSWDAADRSVRWSRLGLTPQ